MSVVVLNVAERPSKDAVPPLYRILSTSSELESLSSLTSSVSFEIKMGSCSRLSRLLFLRATNGTPELDIENQVAAMENIGKSYSGL